MYEWVDKNLKQFRGNKFYEFIKSSLACSKEDFMRSIDVTLDFLEMKI